jgi:hypothetical protein
VWVGSLAGTERSDHRARLRRPVLLAIDRARAARRLHGRRVGEPAQINRREPGVQDQPAHCRLRAVVVAAQEQDHALLGRLAAGLCRLESCRQGVERLDQPRARHPLLVQLGGSPSTRNPLDPAAPELIRRVDHDLAPE